VPAVVIPIVVLVAAVVSIARDAVSSLRARARADVLRREWSGLPHLDGRTADWWKRELDESFRARFTYRKLLAAEPTSAETGNRAARHGRPPCTDPSAGRQLTTLMRQALAFAVLVGTAMGWVTHSYVRGLIAVGLMALATAGPVYVVQRALRAQSNRTR
jgi:hypothetical protein